VKHALLVTSFTLTDEPTTPRRLFLLVLLLSSSSTHLSGLTVKVNNEINLFVINTATIATTRTGPLTLAEPPHHSDPNPAKPRYLTYRVELGAG